jgi:hypothetical protein
MAESLRAVVLAPVTATDVARGVSRLLLAEGLSPVLEFSLPNGRRLDVAALARDGTIAGVEIKVSTADFACDGKWPDYLPYCDLFYFAVPPDFPQNLLPASAGLIVADRFGGAILRQAARVPLHASRRRALTLNFARVAAQRLARAADPHCY